MTVATRQAKSSKTVKQQNNNHDGSIGAKQASEAPCYSKPLCSWSLIFERMVATTCPKHPFLTTWTTPTHTHTYTRSRCTHYFYSFDSIAVL